MKKTEGAMSVPRDRAVKIFFSLLFALLVVYCFLLSLNPLSDPDLWFHLRTGQMTWETSQLPGDVDPFSFTTPNPIPPGALKGLRTQWLGQTMLYLFFDTLGPKGFALLRSLAMVAPFVIFYLAALRRGAPHSGLLFVIGVPLLIMAHVGYDNFERPQVFSFLLAPLVYAIALRLRGSFRMSLSVALVLIMVLWANLHGGYIIGLALLTAVACGAVLAYVAERFNSSASPWLGEPPEKPLAFVLAIFVAIIVTSINPSGWLVYDWAIGLIKNMIVSEGSGLRSGDVMQGIKEYKPVWSFYGKPSADWLYAVTAFYLISVLALGLKYAGRKRIDLSEVFAVGIMLFFGMAYMRGVVFALIFSSMVLSISLVHVKGRRLLAVSGSSALVIAIFAVSLAAYRPWMLSPMPPTYWINRSYPESALRFLDEKGVSGRLFNPMEWGGYIAWRSYPERQVFFDGREISASVFRTFNKIIEAQPEWRQILDDYDVDILLIPLLHGSNGILTPPILRMALEGPGPWRLVFMDHNQVVFVREGAEGAQSVLECCQMPFERLYGHLVDEASLMLLQRPGYPDIMISKALGLFWSGRSADALGILNMLPDNPVALQVKREVTRAMNSDQ